MTAATIPAAVNGGDFPHTAPPADTGYNYFTDADRWAVTGEEFARRFLSDWLYHESHGYAAWSGKAWQFLPKEIAGQRILDAAVKVILGVVQDTWPGPDGIKLAGQWKSSGPVFNSFLAGIRNEIAGKVPPPNRRYFPANNGLFCLETGQLIPHAPEFGFRSIANGDYIGPDLPAYSTALNDRLRPALNPAERDSFFDWCGLVATGRVQNYPGSIAFIIGPARSGKGGILKLLAHGFGGLYFASKPDLFSNNRPTGHDNDLAALLLADPLLVGIDELGGNRVKVSIDRLNNATGNNELGPYTLKGQRGMGIKGTPSFAVVTTGVDAPKFTLDTGLRERLFCLSTHAYLPVEERDSNPLPPYLADALITMCCIRAARMLQAGPLTGFAGTDAAKERIIPEMDPLAAAVRDLLRRPEDWHGAALSDLTSRIQAAFPNAKSNGIGGIVRETKIDGEPWQVTKRKCRNGRQERWLIAPGGLADESYLV